MVIKCRVPLGQFFGQLPGLETTATNCSVTRSLIPRKRISQLRFSLGTTLALHVKRTYLLTWKTKCLLSHFSLFYTIILDLFSIPLNQEVILFFSQGNAQKTQKLLYVK